VRFPDIEWRSAEDIDQNLIKLHHYAEELALSIIDWYLKKKKAKKGVRLSFGTCLTSF